MRLILREPVQAREAAEELERYLRKNPGTIISLTITFEASPLSKILERLTQNGSLSYRQVARGAGISASLLSMINSGQRTLSLAMAEKIRDFLVEHEDLLTKKEREALKF